MYQTTEEQQPNIPEDVIPCLKTWMDQNQVLENQVNNINNNDLVNDRVVMGSCGDLQSLTLSMSPCSQSSCVTASRHISPTETNEGVTMETKKRGLEKIPQKQTVHRKSIDTFGQRTSQYRGVTRHRWTGRYEAHLWDNGCKKEGKTRKGRQVYLGGYDMEDKAARAYDLAALKYWGASTHINFLLENYHDELEEMKNMTRQEYVAHLRRRSSGFSRGASMYRGVTRHHQHGRWKARIGRVSGEDVPAPFMTFEPTRFPPEILQEENQILKDKKRNMRKRLSGSLNEVRKSGHDSRVMKLVLVGSQNIQKVGTGKGSALKHMEM